MSNGLRNLMMFHGALVFLLGLAAGFPFAWAVTAALDPGNPSWLPGDVRAWKMAHLEGVLNGFLVIAFSAVLGPLNLSAKAAKTVAYGLIITAWGNIAASVLSPLTGGRGLGLTGFDWNTLTFLLFVVAIIAVVWVMILIAMAGWRGRHQT